MMPAQFARLEIYSRKKDASGRNTDFIFDEVRRKPYASKHVKDPKPPTVIFGKSIDETQAIHDEVAACATIGIKGGRRRRIRQDQNTLVGIVISFPYTPEEIWADKAKQAEIHEFERNVKATFRNMYGSDLITIVRHMDENFYHLHAYVIPISDPELKAKRYHPGVLAKEAAMVEGRLNKVEPSRLRELADDAYIMAMAIWQDKIFEGISQFSGLTRYGENHEKRLSRAQWSERQRLKQKGVDSPELVLSIKQIEDDDIKPSQQDERMVDPIMRVKAPRIDLQDNMPEGREGFAAYARVLGVDGEVLNLESFDDLIQGNRSVENDGFQSEDSETRADRADRANGEPGNRGYIPGHIKAQPPGGGVEVRAWLERQRQLGDDAKKKATALSGSILDHGPDANNDASPIRPSPPF
jgi:hypothetical protein